MSQSVLAFAAVAGTVDVDSFWACLGDAACRVHLDAEIGVETPPALGPVRTGEEGTDETGREDSGGGKGREKPRDGLSLST